MRKKFDYYNVAHLLAEYPDAHYYMAFGERSNGKTYSALKYAIERYGAAGEQFAYIRRFGEDIRKKNLFNLFDGHLRDGVISKATKGKWDLVDYSMSRFWPIKRNGEEIIKATEPMGYAFDLNSVEHGKGVSYPKITTIIFDEFLSRQGYLQNEFILFTNVLSTIIRERKNVKIFMLGNTVNRYSPYFTEMGLRHVKDQQPGTIDVYTYSNTGLKVVVEYCESSVKKGGKESDVYFAFDNPQLRMITGGEWEIPMYPHLPSKFKPKDIVAQFFIEFEGATLHGNVIVTDTDYYLFIHPKTSPIKDEDSDIVYTTHPSGKWNYRVGIGNQNDRLSLIIFELIRKNRVFYADNETGETLRNYIIWSTKYSSARGG